MGNFCLHICNLLGYSLSLCNGKYSCICAELFYLNGTHLFLLSGIYCIECAMCYCENIEDSMCTLYSRCALPSIGNSRTLPSKMDQLVVLTQHQWEYVVEGAAYCSWSPAGCRHSTYRPFS